MFRRIIITIVVISQVTAINQYLEQILQLGLENGIRHTEYDDGEYLFSR